MTVIQYSNRNSDIHTIFTHIRKVHRYILDNRQTDYDAGKLRYDECHDSACANGAESSGNQTTKQPTTMPHVSSATFTARHNTRITTMKRTTNAMTYCAEQRTQTENYTTVLNVDRQAEQTQTQLTVGQVTAVGKCSRRQCRRHRYTGSSEHRVTDELS